MKTPSDHWEPVRLKDVVKLKTGPFGSALHKSDYVDGGTPLINPTHICGGLLVPSERVSVSRSTAERLSEYTLKTGDVVMGRRGEMGRCAVVPSASNGWLCGTGSVIVRPTGAIDSRFLQRFLSSPTVVEALNGDSVGSTMVNLNQGVLLELETPLPPLAEQKRIADKLDTVLARVDACRDRLDRIPTILKRFRQSVLAAATSGKLTEDWRIKVGCLRGKYGKLGDMGQVLAGQSPSVSEVNFEGRGEPYVTGPEQWDGRKILAHKWTEFPKRIAPENSIFITVKGAGVGKTFPGCRAAIGRDVYAFVSNDDHDKSYVLFAIQASAEDVVLKAKGLIPGLTKSDIVEHEVYIPTREEQKEIVRRVETLFAFANRIEARVNAARESAERLTPALLAKAFRGELVPQDPNDEPATELLKRLSVAESDTPRRKILRGGKEIRR